MGSEQNFQNSSRKPYKIEKKILFLYLEIIDRFLQWLTACVFIELIFS